MITSMVLTTTLHSGLPTTTSFVLTRWLAIRNR